MPVQVLLSWTLFVTAMLASSSADSRLQGRVVDTAGRPVSGVRITHLSESVAASSSGPDGSFDVESPAGPLLFEHRQYAPALLLPRQAAPETVTVVMKDRAATEWRLPRCSSGPETDSPIKTLELKVPRGFRKDISRDADYELVTIRDRSRKAELLYWRTVVSSAHPNSTWLSGLTRLAIRSLDLAGTKGYDATGWSESGRRSRWVGCTYMIVRYSDVEPSIAQQFDAIIDGACYR